MSRENLDPEVAALLADETQLAGFESLLEDIDHASEEEIESAKVSFAKTKTGKTDEVIPDDVDFDQFGERIANKVGKETTVVVSTDTPVNTIDFNTVTEEQIEKFDATQTKEYAKFLKTQNSKVTDFVKLLETFEQNPEAFTLKYMPQYAGNLDSTLKTVNVGSDVTVQLPKGEFEQLVNAKYIDEQGNLLIEINPTHAVIPGTSTYNFNKVVQSGVATIEKAKESQKNVLATIEENNKKQREQFDASLAEAREYAKTNYGIEKQEDFDKLVLGRLSDMSSFKFKDFVDIILFDKAVEKKVQLMVKNKELSIEQIRQIGSPTSGNVANGRPIRTAVKDETKFDWEK